jgi:hypothetical protein
MDQLFSNNAKATLGGTALQGGSSASTSFVVTDLGEASKFPSPSTNQFFEVTIEFNGQREIVRVISRNGTTFNLGSIANRGLEGTTIQDFPAGSTVECRLTSGAIDSFSTSFIPTGGVATLLSPKDSYEYGYSSSDTDPYGNSILLIRKTDDLWSFVNYTDIYSSLVVSTSSSTTVINVSSSLTMGVLQAGEFLVQVLSGPYVGNVRNVTGYTATSITIDTPFGGNDILTVGTTVQIVKANASILAGVSGISYTESRVLVTDGMYDPTRTIITMDHSPGFVDIFANGAKLSPLDFDSTSSASIITLNKARLPNDVVEIISRGVSTVMDAYNMIQSDERFVNKDGYTGKNLLINPEFKLWYRGKTFGAINSPSQTANGWYVGGVHSVSSVSFPPYQTSVPGNPTTYLELDATAGAPRDPILTQVFSRIPGANSLSNSTITFSFYARCPVSFSGGPASTTFKVFAQQNLGTGGTGQNNNLNTISNIFEFTPTSSWARYTFTLVMPPDLAPEVLGTYGDDSVDFYIQNKDFPVAGKLDIAKAQLELGSIATTPESRNINIERIISGAQNCANPDQSFPEVVGENFNGSVPIYRNQNLLLNSNFDIWERGTPFTANAPIQDYYSDRWYTKLSGFTASGSRVVEIYQDNSLISSLPGITSTLRVGVNAPYSLDLYEALDSRVVNQMRGETLTFSIYARGNTTGLNLSAYYHSTLSGTTQIMGSGTLLATKPMSVTYITGNSGWSRASLTFTVPNSAHGLMVGVTGSVATNVLYTDMYLNFAKAQLEAGDIATKVEIFKDVDVELNACRRFFEANVFAAGEILGIASVTSSSTAKFMHHWKTRKRNSNLLAAFLPTTPVSNLQLEIGGVTYPCTASFTDVGNNTQENIVITLNKTPSGASFPTGQSGLLRIPLGWTDIPPGHTDPSFIIAAYNDED